MDKDYSELIEYLNKKFDKLEEEISNLQVKVLDNSGKIDNITEKMATKIEMNKLLDAVDAYMK